MPTQREDVEEQVRAAAVVRAGARRSRSARRPSGSGATRYGPSAPCDRPVREVADLDEHRARRPGRRGTTASCSPISTSLTVDRRELDGLDRLARARRCRPACRGCRVVGGRSGSGTRRLSSTSTCDALPVGRARRRRASPPTRRGAGTSSCRARGCARAGRRRAGRRRPAARRAATTMSESATWKISHGPLVASSVSSGCASAWALGLVGADHHVAHAERLQVRHADRRRRCCRSAARAPGWSSAWTSPPSSGSGTASCRTPRRRGPPSTPCSRRSSAAAASAPSSCRTGRCPRCSPT